MAFLGDGVGDVEGKRIEVVHKQDATSEVIVHDFFKVPDGTDVFPDADSGRRLKRMNAEGTAWKRGLLLRHPTGRYTQGTALPRCLFNFLLGHRRNGDAPPCANRRLPARANRVGLQRADEDVPCRPTGVNIDVAD